MISKMRYNRLVKLIAMRMAWALFVTTTFQGISYADISGKTSFQNLQINSRLGDTITSSDNSHVPGDLGPDDLRQAAEVLGHADAFDETRAAELERNRKTQIAADGAKEDWRAEREAMVRAAEQWWRHRSAPRSFDDPVISEVQGFLTEMNGALQDTLANWDRVAYDDRGFVARIDFPYPGVAGLANTLGALCLLGRFGDDLNISLAEGTFTTPVYMPLAQRSIQRDMGHEWVVLGRESGLYYFSLTDGLFALNRDPDLSVAVMAFKMSNMAGVIPDSERGPMSHRSSYERAVLSRYRDRYDDFVLCPLVQTQEMLDGASGPLDEETDLRIVGQLVEVGTPEVVRWMLRGLVRLGGTTAPMYRGALPNPLRETLGYVFHRGVRPDQAPEAADELERHIRQAISEGREAEIAQVVCDIARRWSGHGRVEGPVAELLARAGRIARGDRTDTDDTSLPAGSPHEVLSGLAGQLGDGGFTRNEIAEDLLGGEVASSTIRSDLTFLGPQHCGVLQRTRVGRRTEWSVSPEARPRMDEILAVLRPLGAMRPDTAAHRRQLVEAEERIVQLLGRETDAVAALSEDEELIREVNDEWPFRSYRVVADPLFDLLTLHGEEDDVEEVAVPNIDHPGYGRVSRRTSGNFTRAIALGLPGIEQLAVTFADGNVVFLRASSVADPEAAYPEIGTSDTRTWGNTAEEVVFSLMWHASMHLAFCQRLPEEDIDSIAEAISSTENRDAAIAYRLIREEYGYEEGDAEERRELAEEALCYILTTVRDERAARNIIGEVLAETGLGPVVEECWEDSRPSDGPEGAVVTEVRRQAGELHAHTGQPSYLDRIAMADTDSTDLPGAEDATYEYTGEPGEIRMSLGAVNRMIQAGRLTPVPIAQHIRNRFEHVWQQVIAPEVIDDVQLVQVPDAEMDRLGLDGPAYGFGNYIVMRASVFREDQALVEGGRLTEFGRTFVHEITARHLGTRQIMARGQGDVHHWAARNMEQQLEMAVLIEHRNHLQDRLQEMTGPRRIFTSAPDAPFPVRIEIAKHAFQNGLTEKIVQRIVDGASWKNTEGLLPSGRALILPLEEDEYLHCQGRTLRAIWMKAVADEATEGPPQMKPYVVAQDQQILQPSRSFEMDRDGKIHCVPVPVHPTGTGFTYEMDNEDAMMSEAFWGGFPTGYPLGTGQFVTMIFEGRPVGFVIIAKESAEEERFGEVIRNKSEKAAIAPGTAAKRSGLRQSVVELGRGTRQGAMELRNLHEMGITHTHPHHGQWVIYEDGRLAFYDFPNARSIRNMSRDEFIFRMLNDFRSMYFNTYVLTSGDGNYSLYGRFRDMMDGIGVSHSPLEEQTNGYFTDENHALVGENRLRRATDPANAIPFLIRYFTARAPGAPTPVEGMTLQQLAQQNDLVRIFVEIGGRLYDRLMASPPTSSMHEVPVAGNVEVANLRLEIASLNHTIETRRTEHQEELDRIELAMQADRDRGLLPIREDIAMDGAGEAEGDEEGTQDDTEEPQEEPSGEAEKKPDEEPKTEPGELTLAVLESAGLAVTQDEASGSLIVGMDIGEDAEGRRVLAQVPIYATGGLMVPETERAAWQEQISQISTGFDETRVAAKEIAAARKGFQQAQEARDSEATKQTQIEAAAPAIAVSQQNGTLAQMRKAGGYDELREEIQKAVFEHTSFEEGFRMFREAIQRTYHIDVNTMAELNELLPDVTSYEVTMCSMLQRLPTVMLISTPRVQLLNALVGKRHRDVGPNMGVPMLYEVDLDGIGFAAGAPDEFRRQNNILFASDEFEYLGITSTSREVELVPFKPDFGRAFRQLVLLNIDDADLYRRVWANAGGSGSDFITQYPMVGHGRLRRAILRQLSTFDRKDLVAGRVAGEIERLGITEADLQRPFGELVEEKRVSPQCLEGLDTLLAMRLANKHIYDTTNQARLTDAGSMLDLFTLAGILEDVPAVFVAEGPFSGYVSGFGKGVKILDATGKVLSTGGYCPFAPYIQMDAQVEMFETLRDVTDNAVATVMFTALENEIEKRNLHSDVERSRVEQIADDLLLAFRIRLETRAKRTLVKTAEERLSYHVLKVGAAEARQIASVVGMLGGACPRVRDVLLNDVKAIRKVTGDLYDVKAVAEGIQRMAQYDPNNGTITIFHYPNRPHLLMTPVERQMFGDRVAHECFHPIWDSLPEQDQRRYGRISWGEQEIKKSELGEHFMTMYSRQASGASSEEDFCEHGAMYLNHPDEFRALAERCPPLRAKYEFFRGLFTFTDTERGEVTVEFATRADVSISAIERDITTTLAQLDAEKAYEEMEQRAERAIAAVRGKLKIRSVDKMAKQEEAEERRYTDAHEDDDEEDEDEYDEEAEARATTYAEAMGDYKEEDAALVMHGVRAALLDADVSRTVVRRAEEEDLAELERAYTQYLDDNDEDALQEALDEVVVRRLGNDEGVNAEAFAAAMREMVEPAEEPREEIRLDPSVFGRVSEVFAKVSVGDTIIIQRNESNPRSFDVDIGGIWRPDDEEALANDTYLFNKGLQEHEITALEVRVAGVPQECFERLFRAIDGNNKQTEADLFDSNMLELGGGIRATVEGGTIIISRVAPGEGPPAGFQGGGVGEAFQRQLAAEANQGSRESLNELVLDIERMILPEHTETLDAILEDLNSQPLTGPGAESAYEVDVRTAIELLEDERMQDRTRTYTIGLNKAGTTKEQRKNIRRLVRTIRKKTGMRITFEREMIDDPAKPTFNFTCRDGSGGLVGQTPIYLRAHSDQDLHLDRSLGILTLGLAAATVPQDLTDSQRAEYAPIINLINRQHARLHITESRLIPDAASAEEIVDILHRKAIHLILPPVHREDFEKFEEFDMQQRMLDKAA